MTSRSDRLLGPASSAIAGAIAGAMPAQAHAEPGRLHGRSGCVGLYRNVVLLAMGERDEPFLLDQIPPANAQLQALGAPVRLHVIAGNNHSDIVLSFDSDHDRVTPLLVAFIHDVAP